jgi:hypothetical protein
MPPISKADLLKPRLEQGTVTIEGLGEFTIRPLTRSEAFDVQTQREESVLAAENLLISLGLVDPKMTVDEVADWAAVAPAGHLAAVSMAIGSISGMMPESRKESYKSPRE